MLKIAKNGLINTAVTACFKMQRWLSKKSSGKPFWHRVSSFEPCQPEDSRCFQLTGERPWAGWNMIELSVEDGVHGTAIIQFEMQGKDFQVGIPVQPGRVAKRLVFVPLGVTRLSMADTNTLSILLVKRLCWVWLTPWFAHDRLARRLSSLHPSYKGKTVREVKRALHRESVARTCLWKTVALEEHTQTFRRATTQFSYRQWVTNIEPSLYQAMKNASFPKADKPPVFSVLLAMQENELARADLAGLRKTLQSLVGQIYPHWNLHLALPTALNEQQVNSVRLLTYNLCGDSAHVSLCSEASLSALMRRAFVQSSGEGVLWISPGDVLAPQALNCVAAAWQEEPSCQLFYADEDVVDEAGKRVLPSFKPEWNPDLLLSAHYIGRMAVYKRRALWRLEVYQEIGRSVRSELKRDDLDHARALRFLAWQFQRNSAAPIAVKHLPWVLYHRHEAHYEAEKQRLDHTRLLVEDWLRLVFPEVNARVSQGQLPYSTHIHWPISTPPPLVSLLVPTRDGVDILRPCVERILETTAYRHFELLILDNQSSCPKTLDYLKDIEARDPRVRVLHWNHPFNYSAINNFGVKHAKGDIIGLVNNDIEPINDDWLTEMVGQVLRSDIGCVGAKLYYPNGTLQHGGVILGLGGIAGHAHRFFPRKADGYCGRLKQTQNMSAVTGACLLVRKDVFNEVSGLNAKKLAVTFNDVDFCLKVHRAGYRNLWTPYAELYHHESMSRGGDNTPEKRTRRLREIAYMRRTWHFLLNQDPAYNPNLTLAYEDFSLRYDQE